MTNHNCLSHWFPILAAAGVPVPRTEIIHCEGSLIPLLDGETPSCFQGLVDQVATVRREVRLPMRFLRTGLQRAASIGGRIPATSQARIKSAVTVASLVEFGELVSMCGLPTDVWVVREFLPGPVREPICPRYRDI